MFPSRTTTANAQKMVFQEKKSSVLLTAKYVYCTLSYTNPLPEVQVILKTNEKKIKPI